MNTKAIMTIAALPFIAACAQSPASIAPASMGGAYAGMPCNQARAELATERQHLSALMEKQQGAVAGDAIGVLLIGVPMSSLTGGDVSGDIAVSKGKVLALEASVSACG